MGPVSLHRSFVSLAAACLILAISPAGATSGSDPLSFDRSIKSESYKAARNRERAELESRRLRNRAATAGRSASAARPASDAMSRATRRLQRRIASQEEDLHPREGSVDALKRREAERSSIAGDARPARWDR